LSGAAKLKGIKEWLENILPNKETKFILYAHHMVVLDELEKFLVKNLNGDTLIRIDGNTNPAKR
jgi:hypothetical protein